MLYIAETLKDKKHPEKICVAVTTKKEKELPQKTNIKILAWGKNQHILKSSCLSKFENLPKTYFNRRYLASGGKESFLMV